MELKGEEKSQYNMVTERLEKMRRKRQGYESDWKDAEKQRMMELTQQTEEDWRSNLKLPDTFSIIETAKAEMIDQSPSLYYRPRESGDNLKAEKMNKIFDYTWEKGNGDLQLMNFIDDSLVYGLAIGEEYWKQDIQNKKEIEEFDIEKFQPIKWKKKEDIIFDDVFFETLKIWDFYWDPMADCLENARDCAKVQTFTKEDFQRIYKRFPRAKKVVSGSMIFKPEWFKAIGNPDDHQVEVISYYNKYEDLYLVVANGILMTQVNNPIPYKHKDFPFVRGVDILIPHSFVGMGEPKLMKCLQEERDTLRNMRIDTAHLNIQIQYIVDDRLELDDDDLIARPHGIIRGPIDSIAPVQRQPLFAESYREEEFINDDIIKATGVDIRMQSIGGQGDTATEVAILKESSLKRIRLKLKLLEKMCLHRIGRLRLSNVQQFYSIPKIKMIVGDNGNLEEEETYKNIGFSTNQGEYDWFTANPDDLTGEFDVVVIPGATLPVSKALESQKRLNLYDRLAGHPEVNQRELVRMLIKVHDEDDRKLLNKGGQTPPPGMAGMPPGTEAMPPVGVNRSPARLKPEETLPGRVMAGGAT